MALGPEYQQMVPEFYNEPQVQPRFIEFCEFTDSSIYSIYKLHI